MFTLNSESSTTSRHKTQQSCPANVVLAVFQDDVLYGQVRPIYRDAGVDAIYYDVAAF